MTSICTAESSLYKNIDRYDFILIDDGVDFAKTFLPSVTSSYLRDGEMEPLDLQEPDLVVSDAFEDATYEENWNIPWQITQQINTIDGEEEEEEERYDADDSDETETESRSTYTSVSRSLSDAFDLYGPVLPVVEERFKLGRHYIVDNGVVQLGTFKCVHKLVDLARYFIMKNRYCFPYLIAKFKVVRLENSYDFEIIFVNCFNRFRFVFKGANCLKQFAFYLLRYNRFAGIHNVFIEGFLFWKLRMLLEYFSSLLSFEVFASCSLKHRGSYAFRNQFGVVFVCHIKKDTGQPVPFDEECFIRSPSMNVTALHDLFLPSKALHFFRNKGYRIFQEKWKFFSDFFSFSTSSLYQSAFLTKRFHLLANVVPTVETVKRKKKVSITMCGIMNSYCKVFPSTPIDSFVRDRRCFKGYTAFAKFLIFLLLSIELYDCDYVFQLFGTCFFNEIGRLLSRHADAFGVVSDVCVSDSGSRFRLEMKSGRVHDFVRKPCFLSNDVSFPKRVLSDSKKELDRFCNAETIRGVKRKIDDC